MPFYFDLSTRGFAGDADARAFVVKKVPALGGRQVPTPPVLFMSPEGELLAQVSNYASVEQVLAAMRKVLVDHPAYAAWSAAEKAEGDPVAKAQIHVDLGEYAKAKAVLAKERSEEAAYLRGRLARFAGDWEVMEKEFATIKGDTLRDDVRMERAHRHWKAGAFEPLAKVLADFPIYSNRFTEARYHEGLAHFHAGRVAQARTIWASTVKGCAQDPWIYRADWAYCQTKAKKKGGRTFFSSRGPRDSLLNRIGYMGPRGNPDLKAR